MAALWWWPFGRVPEISAPVLHAEMVLGTNAPQILYVRTLSEWNDYRIDGSLNVPVTELKSKIRSLALDRHRPIVAVCRSARRSIPAVRLLQRHGFKQVCQLQGGMLAWRQANLPVVSDAAGK